MGDHPRVGIGVIVIKDNKVLLGKRKGSHGEGTWSFPGGHLEFNEQLEDCARRELREETGIEIKSIRLGTFTNDIFHEEGKHYITLYLIAEHEAGEEKIMEPDKCEKWQWFEWNNLPEQLFLPLKNLLKNNYSPFK